MKARTTSGHTIEVTVIYKIGSFRLYRSIPGVKEIYTISNSYGIAIGYCRSIDHGRRAMRKLHNQFGDRLNLDHINVDNELYAEATEFYNNCPYIKRFHFIR